MFIMMSDNVLEETSDLTTLCHDVCVHTREIFRSVQLIRNALVFYYLACNAWTLCISTLNAFVARTLFV